MASNYITQKQIKEFAVRWDNPNNITLKPSQREIVDKFLGFGHKRVLFGLKAGTGKTYSSLTWMKENGIYDFTVVATKTTKVQWSFSVADIYQKQSMIIFLQDDPKIKKYGSNYKFEWWKYQTRKEGYYKELLDKYPQYQGIIFIAVQQTATNVFKYINDLIMQHKESLPNSPVFNLIIDESQFIKHSNSLSTKMFMKFNEYFNYVALLTGSIFSNDIDQIYAQFCILNNFSKLTVSNFKSTYFKRKDVEINKGKIIVKYGRYKDDYIHREYNLKHIDEPLKQKSIYKDILLTKLSRNSEFLTNDDLIPHPIKYVAIKDTDDSIKFASVVIEGVMYNNDLEGENGYIATFTTPVSKMMKFRQLMSGYNYYHIMKKENVKQLIDPIKAMDNEGFIDELIALQNQHDGEKFINQKINNTLVGTINNKKEQKVGLDEVELFINEFNKDERNQYRDVFSALTTHFSLGRTITFDKENQRRKIFESFVENTLNKENTVAFYQEKGERQIIEEVFLNQGYKIHYIDGENSNIRGIISDLDTNSEIPHAILIQTRSGARGIDGLQDHVYNVVWYILPFSSEQWEQANARIHRIGQEKQVNVFYLSINDFDEKLYDKINNSQNVKDDIFYKKTFNYLLNGIKYINK